MWAKGSPATRPVAHGFGRAGRQPCHSSKLERGFSS